MTEKESKKGLGLLLAVLGGIAGIALLTRNVLLKPTQTAQITAVTFKAG